MKFVRPGALFLFLFVCLFFGVNSAHALSGMRLQAFVYNPEIRFERDEDQSLAQRRPVGYAAALRKGILSGLAEISSFKTNSGNNSLNISREHQEYMFWGRAHFANYEKAPVNLSLYVGGGVGTYQETIITSLNGSLTTDTGKREIEGGLVFGGDSVYLLQNDLGVIVGAEARLLFGKEFDPNPQMSALLRFGVQF